MYNEAQEAMKPKPVKCSLGQISLMRDILERDEHVSKHFEVEWEALENWLTEGRRKYIYSLLRDKKYIELNRLLDQFLKRKLN